MNKRMIFFFVPFFIFQCASSMDHSSIDALLLAQREGNSLNETVLIDLEGLCSSTKNLSDDFFKKLICLLPVLTFPDLSGFFHEGEMKEEVPSSILLAAYLQVLDKVIEIHEITKKVNYPNLREMILKLRGVLDPSNIDIEAGDREAMQRSAAEFKRQCGVINGHMRKRRCVIC